MKTNGLWFVAATVGGYLVFNLVICGFGGSADPLGCSNNRDGGRGRHRDRTWPSVSRVARGDGGQP